MKQEDYPEKIYVRSYFDDDTAFGLYANAEDYCFGKNIPYIKADVAQKKIELEYEIGLYKGENYPIWHKADDYPPYYKDVLLCNFDNKMFVGFYSEKYKDYISRGTCGDIVPIAWMELPEPYKEN